MNEEYSDYCRTHNRLWREGGVKNGKYEVDGEAYCYICTEKVEWCRCPCGEGANRL